MRLHFFCISIVSAHGQLDFSCEFFNWRNIKSIFRSKLVCKPKTCTIPQIGDLVARWFIVFPESWRNNESFVDWRLPVWRYGWDATSEAAFPVIPLRAQCKNKTFVMHARCEIKYDKLQNILRHPPSSTKDIVKKLLTSLLILGAVDTWYLDVKSFCENICRDTFPRFFCG